MDSEFLSKSLETFHGLTNKPEVFLESDKQGCADLNVNLKQLYDFMKSEEVKTVKSEALPELMTKNFDVEQIWQQIELQNDSLLQRSLVNVSKLVVKKDTISLLKNTKENKIQSDEIDKNSSTASDDDDDDCQQENDNMEIDDHDSINASDFDDVEDTNEGRELENNVKTQKKSAVEDDFLNLNEMEQFLNAEEKKLNDPDSGNDTENSESESEGSVDLFEEMSDENENKAEMAKYKDFFIAKEDKQISKNEEQKSSFEHREERLKRKIDEIEENAVKEKSWQLKGEITGENRPQNSLLEEVVDFDLTTRPAPVITEQTTMQLEDIIKQRIKEKVFDSVERKTKPAETPLEFKKKLLLDQEKSKESLAQIYEKEFLEQKAALDPENSSKDEEEPELHKEINKTMNGLFLKLDALSNFHFTPKPAVPELKIVSNLPAISMEEVAPVTSTEAYLLAPEELKNKPKGDLIGKSERTGADKRRERRKKKTKQKIHSKKEKTAKSKNTKRNFVHK